MDEITLLLFPAFHVHASERSFTTRAATAMRTAYGCTHISE